MSNPSSKEKAAHTHEKPAGEQPAPTPEAPQATPEPAPAPKTGEKAPQAAPATPEGEENVLDLEQLQADVDRFRDLAMRARADFDNYRKRSIREKEEAVKYANLSLLERLIPLFDNFELGLQAARADGSQGVLLGFEMVAKQFQEFLATSGVEPIEAEGKPFDPNLHEAMGGEPSDTVPEGVVIRQMRKGYKLRDRLIRPATVFVSKGKA